MSWKFLQLEWEGVTGPKYSPHHCPSKVWSKWEGALGPQHSPLCIPLSQGNSAAVVGWNPRIKALNPILPMPNWCRCSKTSWWSSTCTHPWKCQLAIIRFKIVKEKNVHHASQNEIISYTILFLQIKKGRVATFEYPSVYIEYILYLKNPQ